jgi:aspartate-semialdehyde dehydrogenase
MDSQRFRKPPNIAIIGSSSLLGKELREMLELRSLPIGRLTLLETEEYAGLLQEFAGEIQITQVISPDALADIDIAFFTCGPEIMQAYVASGAKFPGFTIDLTQAGPEGIVYLHGISEFRLLRAQGLFVNPHPAAIVIGRIIALLHNTYILESAAVTILEPASERGNAGVDELQEQTVSLLNFQPVERKVFNGQLAFNILPEPEASARTEGRIMQQLETILGKTFPRPAIHAVQAPVFHSHAFSMFVSVPATTEQLSAEFANNPSFQIDHRSGDPSPVSVVGSDKIHIHRLRFTGHTHGGHAFWAVSDNLRIAASNAIQTAEQIMLALALEA